MKYIDIGDSMSAHLFLKKIFTINSSLKQVDLLKSLIKIFIIEIQFIIFLLNTRKTIYIKQKMCNKI